jgi:hypothetical protein
MRCSLVWVGDRCCTDSGPEERTLAACMEEGMGRWEGMGGWEEDIGMGLDTGLSSQPHHCTVQGS